MENYHWDYFTRSIFINASKEKVFDAWTIPAQIETWFLEKADFIDRLNRPRPKNERIEDNDKYQWKWWNHDAIEEGRVQTVDPEMRYIDFLFVGEKCPVRILFKEYNGKTFISLSQSRIPQDENSKVKIHMGCSQGWSFWMVNLKAWLEHGVLLNEKEALDQELGIDSAELVNR